MNVAILNKYGISFQKQENGNIKVNATSYNFSNFFYMLARSKSELEAFLESINLALKGSYNEIPYDSRECSQEVGLLIYTGIIQDDMTFDIFLEDQYDNTIETFPLSDVKEISESLLEFIS